MTSDYPDWQPQSLAAVGQVIVASGLSYPSGSSSQILTVPQDRGYVSALGVSLVSGPNSPSGIIQLVGYQTNTVYLYSPLSSIANYDTYYGLPGSIFVVIPFAGALDANVSLYIQTNQYITAYVIGYVSAIPQGPLIPRPRTFAVWKQFTSAGQTVLLAGGSSFAYTVVGASFANLSSSVNTEVIIHTGNSGSPLIREYMPYQSTRVVLPGGLYVPVGNSVYLQSTAAVDLRATLYYSISAP